MYENLEISNTPLSNGNFRIRALYSVYLCGIRCIDERGRRNIA
jgi:hypothetical protein